MLLPALGLLAGAGLLFSVRIKFRWSGRGRAASQAQFPQGVYAQTFHNGSRLPPTWGAPVCSRLSASISQGDLSHGGTPLPSRPAKETLSPTPVTCWWGGACAAAGDPIPEACSDLYLSEPRPPWVWTGLRVCSATDLLREVCRSLCGWRDPRGRWRSRPRSPLGSFPHGVAAAAGLPSAPSPGTQSAARRTPRERFAGLSGAEISLTPIFRGLWVQNSP